MTRVSVFSPEQGVVTDEFQAPWDGWYLMQIRNDAGAFRMLRINSLRRQVRTVLVPRIFLGVAPAAASLYFAVGNASPTVETVGTCTAQLYTRVWLNEHDLVQSYACTILRVLFEGESIPVWITSGED
jgi:hypothetical protein